MDGKRTRPAEAFERRQRRSGVGLDWNPRRLGLFGDGDGVVVEVVLVMVVVVGL